jgi:hypothetical protein
MLNINGFVSPTWLILALLAGCGGEKQPSVPTPSTSASASVVQKAVSGPDTMPVSATEKPVPSAKAGRPLALSTTKPAPLARLAALPLLASLSDRDKATLLKQLDRASPSARLGLINGYQSLEGLPDQQKEILLAQLEDIVPVTTPASRLVCNCSNDIKRELCVKESCSDQMELESICTHTCGTLAAFGHQCSVSPQCAAR